MLKVSNPMAYFGRPKFHVKNFHSKSQIKSISFEEGSRLTDLDHIKEALIDFYSNLWS